MHPLKILFITLEFRTGTFSGNGVYATAQVRALAAAGHSVFVISAAPAHATRPNDDFGVKQIHEVPVSSWHRLDAGAPWREFAAGVRDARLAQAVAAFGPDVVLGVDWSALPAVRDIMPYCGGAPYVYLNYRVFTRTAEGPDLELVQGLEAAAMSESLLTVALSRSDADYLATRVASAAPARPPPHRDPHVQPQPQVWAQAQPQAQVQAQAQLREQATQPVNLGDQGAQAPEGSQREAQAWAEVQQLPCQDQDTGSQRPELPQPPGPPAAPLVTAPARVPKVLLPALREDVRSLDPPSDLQLPPGGACDAAAEATAWAAARPYLSCVVRLSPEKEPERFVALVEAMAARGVLRRHQLTPLLLGVANDEYAQSLKARLRAAAPSSVILERFMGPGELAEVYRMTRLNFHPSTYDAYGMTIVEAASQGAPSVVHDGGGAVGATDLLRGAQGEVVLLDLKAPSEELALEVSRVLEHPQALAATSVRAMGRARSWDEAANAEELVRLVREAMTQCAAAAQPVQPVPV